MRKAVAHETRILCLLSHKEHLADRMRLCRFVNVQCPNGAASTAATKAQNIWDKFPPFVILQIVAQSREFHLFSKSVGGADEDACLRTGYLFMTMPILLD